MPGRDEHMEYRIKYPVIICVNHHAYMKIFHSPGGAKSFFNLEASLTPDIRI